jgi:hypothetical protein
MLSLLIQCCKVLHVQKRTLTRALHILVSQCIHHRLAQHEQQLALVSRERNDLITHVEALTGSIDEFGDDADDTMTVSKSYKNRSVI